MREDAGKAEGQTAQDKHDRVGYSKSGCQHDQGDNDENQKSIFNEESIHRNNL
jgi:hypothetical protein